MKKMYVFLLIISVVMFFVFGAVLVYIHFFDNSPLKNVNLIIERILELIVLLNIISVCLLAFILKKLNKK